MNTQPNTEKQPKYFEARISQYEGVKPYPLEVCPTVNQAIEYIKSDARLQADIDDARKYLKQELTANVRDASGKLLLPEYEADALEFVAARREAYRVWVHVMLHHRKPAARAEGGDVQ